MDGLTALFAPITLLEWAGLFVSLFNTMVAGWLGGTVLLNAERRTWGLVLGGGGLLIGAAFFLGHTAILGGYVGPWTEVWWYLAWGPALAAPFAWYVAMLWYAGFSPQRPTPLYRRHRVLLPLAGLLALSLAGSLALSALLPGYGALWRELWAALGLTGFSARILLYPLYSVVCIGLSLDALRRPAPSERAMGDLARQRAWPWLSAAAGMLLAVSLLVAAGMLWLISNPNDIRRWEQTYTGLPVPLALLDLISAVLLAAAIILLGQAIVSYEVFTGKTLPRRGLLRHWRRMLILATGYGALVGWSLARHWQPISALLLTTVLLALFYTLFSWRVYVERDRYMDGLRPFVTGPRLYDELLAPPPSAPSDVDVQTPFAALCGEVLGARAAALLALGPLSPLVGPPLTYPAGSPPPAPLTGEDLARFSQPQLMYIPVDPDQPGGAAGWWVPLWSERGLIGVLWLGAKRDGGLYTQEEIEIARASGERLIDTKASAEMGARLMALQRQRLAESQVLDRQARRVLHDDVLPRIHAAMLQLGAAPAEAVPGDTLTLLGDAHRQISDLLRDLPSSAAPAVARLGLLGALRQAVENDLGQAFDGVTWQIAPPAAAAAAAVPPLTAEVLFYAAREAIRNAARYGRADHPDRPLHLRIAVSAPAGLEILIEDDGVGLGTPAPRLGSGAGTGGHGLALHSTMMAVVGGALATDSLPGRYTRVLLTLPQGS